MKIEGLRLEKKGDRTRMEATVRWEDCERPAQKVYFETDEKFAGCLSCDPHAFLVACIIPAMRHGEKRVFIDAEICPELRNGLIIAMRLIRSWYNWYGSDRKLVRIEGKAMYNERSTPTPETAGFFFSGGIDSLATLRANRLNFPLEHPRSFRYGFLVHGLQRPIDKVFEHVESSLSVVAQEAGITLVVPSTNIRYLLDDWDFWEDEFEGAVFSAIAHAFKPLVRSVTIASSFDYINLHPHGSHPLLDPNYGSSDLRIRHDDVTLSRLAKTKLVADWDVALQNIRVCNAPELPDILNCGKCEKCVRTMLALLALGRLDHTHVFAMKDVSEELVRSAVHLTKTNYPFYPELITPLAERGRHDLVGAIKRKITIYHQSMRKEKWKKKLKDFDDKHLKGHLMKLKRSVYS